MKIVGIVLYLSVSICAAQSPMGGLTAQPTGSTPTLVGTKTCGRTAYGLSPSISYTPYATGDTLYLALWGIGTPVTYSSVTDNKGDVPTLVSGAESSSYGGIYMFSDISAGVTLLSASTSSSTYTTYCIIDFQHVSSTGSTAQNSVTTTGSSSPWAYTTNLSLAHTNDYLYAVCTSSSSTALTATAAAGALAGNEAYAYSNMFAQYNSASAPGNVTISGTATGPSANFTMHCTLIDVE